MNHVPEMKHIDKAGNYVDENSADAAYVVNTADPDSEKFVESVREQHRREEEKRAKHTPLNRTPQTGEAKQTEATARTEVSPADTTAANDDTPNTGEEVPEELRVRRSRGRNK